MAFSLLAWLLAGVLAVTCLAVARSAWNFGGRGPGISRMALLSSMLETAATAAFFRLVVPWSPGTTLLWVVAMAALAVAVAGAVIRWPELPSHAGLLDFEEPEPGTTESDSPEPGSGVTLRTKPSRKVKKKSTKKEPGRRAVAVRAGVLAAVVVLSFAVG
ncbi:hypothetical protein [Arthrobacter sunyaminii]|uniref:Uncharacterized protein n=1 Tax=Arthrobacter sunyaminii TaxID=2816859 RepID=A0A975S6Y8_9MICC|nr:hypothetical protein [Arthrobacter sunyaminii]MBO0907895.1 hypothetical protein [Arthrobacter sunyaminii]QWQ36948.1 hypothetical protein KG104_03885 [Arthrobacter sunyaminii]